MRLDELDPIAEGIGGKRPIEAFDRLGVVLHLQTRVGQGMQEIGETPDEKCRVRLLGRAKVGFDAEVQLQRAAAKPNTAANGEIGGFRDFRQAENASVKAARQRLTAGGHGKLDVIDSVNGHCRILTLD